MKKIDAHAHVFDHIGSMGKAGELRPLGNGNCRWATGEEFRIIPEGKGDKEYLVEAFMDVMDENDVEKAILLQGVLYGLQNEYAMECAEKYPDRFKAAVMLAADFGSTPITLIFGFSIFAKVEIPVTSPPPPIGARI